MVNDKARMRRHLAVVEGGGHLVVRDGRAPGHARADFGELGLEAAMVPRMASIVPRLSAKLPSSRRCFTNRKSQLPVGRRRSTRRRDRRGGPPRRRWPTERYTADLPSRRAGDLVDRRLEKAQVRRPPAAQPEIEESERHRVGDLLIEALEEPGQRRVGRVALDELLVVEEPIAQLGQLVDGQVEQAAPVEIGGIDPVRDPRRRQPLLSELRTSRAA